MYTDIMGRLIQLGDIVAYATPSRYAPDLQWGLLVGIDVDKKKFKVRSMKSVYDYKNHAWNKIPGTSVLNADNGRLMVISPADYSQDVTDFLSLVGQG